MFRYFPLQCIQTAFCYDGTNTHTLTGLQGETNKTSGKTFPGRSSIRFLRPFGLSTAEKVKSFCHPDTCVVVRGTYCTDFEDWDLNLLNSPGAVHSVPSCNTEETRHRSERSLRQAGEEKGAPQASEQYEKFSLVCKSF